MRDYIDFLATHPARWEPFITPELTDPAWHNKFDTADTQGKENIALAWMWALNQDLASRNFVKPCAGLVGNLANYVPSLLKFGPFVTTPKTSNWLVTGGHENIAALINFNGDFPEAHPALSKIWAADYLIKIEGVRALAPIFERYHEPTEKLAQYVFIFLHDLVWHVLDQTSCADANARSVAYKLISRLNQEYTYSGPHARYVNDEVALAWDSFCHAGAERDWTEESRLNFIRSTLLKRPLQERIDIIVYLADGWVNNARAKTRQELTRCDLDIDSIYNWDRLTNPTVYDLMAQWLPEVKGGLCTAFSAGIYLNELGAYLRSSPVVNTTVTALPMDLADTFVTT